MPSSMCKAYYITNSLIYNWFLRDFVFSSSVLLRVIGKTGLLWERGSVMFLIWLLFFRLTWFCVYFGALWMENSRVSACHLTWGKWQVYCVFLSVFHRKEKMTVYFLPPCLQFQVLGWPVKWSVLQNPPRWWVIQAPGTSRPQQFGHNFRQHI